MTSFKDEIEQRAARLYSTPFRSVPMEQDVDRQRKAFIAGALWAEERLRGDDQADSNPEEATR